MVDRDEQDVSAPAPTDPVENQLAPGVTFVPAGDEPAAEPEHAQPVGEQLVEDGPGGSPPPEKVEDP